MQILQNRALDKLRTQRRPELLSMNLHLEIGRDLSNCKIGTSKVLEGRMLKWAIVATLVKFRQIASEYENGSFFKQTSVSCIRRIAKRSTLRVHRAEHVRPSNDENDQKCEKQQSRNELSLFRSLIGGRRSGCRHGRR